MSDSAGIVFFGTSEFAVPILKALAESAFRPALVVTTPDQPAGRGQRIAPPPIKHAAEELGLPIIQPERLAPLPKELAVPRALFLVASYGKILPAELLALPAHGALNVHPSLLPRWRGASPIPFAILEGDAETGVTVMQMDEKMDHGPIVAQSNFSIRDSKYAAPELQERLSALGAKLLLETIPQWLSGEIAGEPQDESRATYSRILKREDGRIRWDAPARAIERMVRAFQPWPGAFTFWQRGSDRVRLMVDRADVAPSAGEDARPGAVLADADGIGVATGEGILVIRAVRPEGGRTMEASAFLRGHPDIVGARLD